MKIHKFQGFLNQAKNIVFFGGAGTSTESNIPDFRSAKSGLYEVASKYPYPPEKIVSKVFFELHPKIFFEFFRNELVFKDAKPNAAHIALTKLEKMGKLKSIITQNVDNLHQKSGSKNVLELHGSVYDNYCIDCNRKYNLDFILDSTKIIPKCMKCAGIVRPNVVLYGEAPDKRILRRARRAISRADMLIIGGTSLEVYPAAGLINHFKGNNLA